MCGIHLNQPSHYSQPNQSEECDNYKSRMVRVRNPYKLVVRFCSAAILKTGTHASTGLLETHCQCLVLRLYTTVATNRMSTLLIPLGRVPICITTKALSIYNLAQPRRPLLRKQEQVHTYDFSQCAPKSGLVTQIHDRTHELTATMVHHVPQASFHPLWIYALRVLPTPVMQKSIIYTSKMG